MDLSAFSPTHTPPLARTDFLGALAHHASAEALWALARSGQLTREDLYTPLTLPTEHGTLRTGFFLEHWLARQPTQLRKNGEPHPAADDPLPMAARALPAELPARHGLLAWAASDRRATQLMGQLYLGDPMLWHSDFLPGEPDDHADLLPQLMQLDAYWAAHALCQVSPLAARPQGHLAKVLKFVLDNQLDRFLAVLLHHHPGIYQAVECLDGTPALHLARTPRAVQLLLEAGADSQVLDAYGQRCDESWRSRRVDSVVAEQMTATVLAFGAGAPEADDMQALASDRRFRGLSLHSADELKDWLATLPENLGLGPENHSPGVVLWEELSGNRLRKGAWAAELIQRPASELDRVEGQLQVRDYLWIMLARRGSKRDVQLLAKHDPQGLAPSTWVQRLTGLMTQEITRTHAGLAAMAAIPANTRTSNPNYDALRSQDSIHLGNLKRLRTACLALGLHAQGRRAKMDQSDMRALQEFFAKAAPNQSLTLEDQVALVQASGACLALLASSSDGSDLPLMDHLQEWWQGVLQHPDLTAEQAGRVLQAYEAAAAHHLFALGLRLQIRPPQEVQALPLLQHAPLDLLQGVNILPDRLGDSPRVNACMAGRWAAAERAGVVPNLDFLDALAAHLHTLDRAGTSELAHWLERSAAQVRMEQGLPEATSPRRMRM